MLQIFMQDLLAPDILLQCKEFELFVNIDSVDLVCSEAIQDFLLKEWAMLTCSCAAQALKVFVLLRLISGVQVVHDGKCGHWEESHLQVSQVQVAAMCILHVTTIISLM